MTTKLDLAKAWIKKHANGAKDDKFFQKMEDIIECLAYSYATGLGAREVFNCPEVYCASLPIDSIKLNAAKFPGMLELKDPDVIEEAKTTPDQTNTWITMSILFDKAFVYADALVSTRDKEGRMHPKYFFPKVSAHVFEKYCGGMDVPNFNDFGPGKTLLNRTVHKVFSNFAHPNRIYAAYEKLLQIPD